MNFTPRANYISIVNIKIMKKFVGILLLGLTTVFSASASISSMSVEETIKKRIAMFKSSEKNIKRLSKLIRLGDVGKANQMMDFHIAWSENMPFLFPLGSEASTSNGSDASADIWNDPIGFTNSVKQYNLAAKELKKSLRSTEAKSINQAFKSFVGACKGCHKRFRN